MKGSSVCLIFYMVNGRTDSAGNYNEKFYLVPCFLRKLFSYKKKKENLEPQYNTLLISSPVICWVTKGNKVQQLATVICHLAVNFYW